MVGGSGEISPLPPTIFVMITNQKWQLYPKKALESLELYPCFKSLYLVVAGEGLEPPASGL